MALLLPSPLICAKRGHAGFQPGLAASNPEWSRFLISTGAR